MYWLAFRFRGVRRPGLARAACCGALNRVEKVRHEFSVLWRSSGAVSARCASDPERCPDKCWGQLFAEEASETATARIQRTCWRRIDRIRAWPNLGQIGGSRLRARRGGCGASLCLVPYSVGSGTPLGGGSCRECTGPLLRPRPIGYMLVRAHCSSGSHGPETSVCTALCSWQGQCSQRSSFFRGSTMS